MPCLFCDPTVTLWTNSEPCCDRVYYVLPCCVRLRILLGTWPEPDLRDHFVADVKMSLLFGVVRVEEDVRAVVRLCPAYLDRMPGICSSRVNKAATVRLPDRTH